MYGVSWIDSRAVEVVTDFGSIEAGDHVYVRNVNGAAKTLSYDEVRVIGPTDLRCPYDDEYLAVMHVDRTGRRARMCACLVEDGAVYRVSPGGIIQIDDYGHWAGARQAVHEFFNERRINPALKFIDESGRQFVKT